MTSVGSVRPPGPCAEAIAASPAMRVDTIQVRECFWPLLLRSFVSFARIGPQVVYFDLVRGLSEMVFPFKCVKLIEFFVSYWNFIVPNLVDLCVVFIVLEFKSCRGKMLHVCWFSIVQYRSQN